MQRILRNEATHTTFGHDTGPALRVEQGEKFVVETQDNAFGTIRSSDDVPDVSHPALETRQYASFNPLGGPVHVDGAQPGDALEVRIDEVEIVGDGWTGLVAGHGWFTNTIGWEECAVPHSSILEHRPGPSGTLADGSATMQGDAGAYSWALAPFIGTIVTAPERGRENSLISQGPWGGNLDVREIAAGARIRLNVGAPGALLYLGDVHGSQGDGELTGIANEVAANVTLSCRVLEQQHVPGVCRIETETSLIQVDSARNAGDLRSAIWNCYLHAMNWLHEEYGVSKRDAYKLMSVHPGVEARIYQFTPRLGTCGVKVPKEIALS